MIEEQTKQTTTKFPSWIRFTLIIFAALSSTSIIVSLILIPNVACVIYYKGSSCLVLNKTQCHLFVSEFLIFFFNFLKVDYVPTFVFNHSKIVSKANETPNQEYCKNKWTDNYNVCLFCFLIFLINFLCTG